MTAGQNFMPGFYAYFPCRFCYKITGCGCIDDWTCDEISWSKITVKIPFRHQPLPHVIILYNICQQCLQSLFLIMSRRGKPLQRNMIPADTVFHVIPLRLYWIVLMIGCPINFNNQDRLMAELIINQKIHMSMGILMN